MKNKTPESLADKIAGILNTTPSNFDPEEDVVDATNAQVSFESIEDNNEEEEILSKFRRENIDLLADVDVKYAGKKTSRKNLRENLKEDNVEASSDDEEHSDDVNEGESSSEDNESLKKEENEEVEEESEEEEESGDEEEVSEEGEEEIATDFSESEGKEMDNNFKHISDTNVSNQIKKGNCVRNQMTMWENFLEIRIQLQKCLLAANKMPQKAKFDEIKQQSSTEFSSKVAETKSSLCGTLDKLLTLQKLLLKQYPETKNLEKENVQESNNGDNEDEEIPSDTDPDESEHEEQTVSVKTPKKRKFVDYEDEINGHHKKYRDYRNKVIQKWNDKTRVVLKGGATSHSVIDQIEYNLSNKDKLLKRTRQKRSHYVILGEDRDGEDKIEEEYNTEIFDDDDFYHQLLRELIEVKSADVTDPVQLGRQWIQLQNMRSKMKRKIDTRATKGRKIRYAVHSKLVNFMASIEGELWTDEAKTELYNSLFGKNQSVFNV